jgi:predicted NUDIX family NTP pyrophosphohydrolase
MSARFWPSRAIVLLHSSKLAEVARASQPGRAAAARRRSAGLLLFRRSSRGMEVFLVHPGGPLWARKDLGAWSIPKGEHSENEDAFAAALREFEEETGQKAEGRALPLGEVRQKSGKIVTAWAMEADADAARIRSNSFAMEWPPQSGKTQQFPEVDRAGWFLFDTARQKLLPSQTPFLDRLAALVEDTRA